MSNLELVKEIAAAWQHKTSASIQVLETGYEVWTQMELEDGRIHKYPIEYFSSCYVDEENKIYLVLPCIERTALCNKASIKEVAGIILAHEIGHSLDPHLGYYDDFHSAYCSLKLKKEEMYHDKIVSPFKYQGELSAWEIADRIHPKTELYMSVRKYALDSYKSKISYP